MKKIVAWLVWILLALLLTACSAAQGAVQGLQNLPDEGRLLVLSVVTAGVLWGLLKLSLVFKVDLSGYANVVAVALAPILVTIIEHWLQLVPPIFDNLVLALIHMLVLLVGSIGTFFLLRRKTPSLW